jgi:hypothetical protein
MARVFLLSPARLGGERARIRILPRSAAQFPLARALRDGGVSLGEVMTFMSGLYFRGKRSYAEAFGRPPGGVASGGLIVTSNRGLWPSTRAIAAIARRSSATSSSWPRPRPRSSCSAASRPRSTWRR